MTVWGNALFVGALALGFSASARIVTITDHGAVPGDCLQTKAIQSAVDAVWQAGGGEVRVPEGVFRTGAIRLRSGVTLRLMEGAELEGSRDPEDYGVLDRDRLEPMTPVAARTNGLTRSANPLSRWSHALIRAYGAHDVAVIGERHSRIDGMNCFDAQGEEGYRGPHAISFWNCTNVVLRGCEVRNSANWAHIVVRCANVSCSGVRVFGGHDGFDLHLSDDVTVSNCTFHTGDDGIAGFGNRRTHVSDCVFSTACHDIRFGGTEAIFERCRGVSPALFGHRYTMTMDDRRLALTRGEGLRRNTFAAFAYYCDGRWGEVPRPGRIVFRDCSFENRDRFMLMDYSEGTLWCSYRPLASVLFENCRFTGVREPARVFGGAEDPVSFAMRDCVVEAAEGCGENAVAEFRDFLGCRFERVSLNGFADPHVRTLTGGSVDRLGGTPFEVRKGK